MRGVRVCVRGFFTARLGGTGPRLMRLHGAGTAAGTSRPSFFRSGGSCSALPTARGAQQGLPSSGSYVSRFAGFAHRKRGVAEPTVVAWTLVAEERTLPRRGLAHRKRGGAGRSIPLACIAGARLQPQQPNAHASLVCQFLRSLMQFRHACLVKTMHGMAGTVPSFILQLPTSQPPQARPRTQPG